MCPLRKIQCPEWLLKCWAGSRLYLRAQFLCCAPPLLPLIPWANLAVAPLSSPSLSQLLSFQACGLPFLPLSPRPSFADCCLLSVHFYDISQDQWSFLSLQCLPSVPTLPVISQNSWFHSLSANSLSHQFCTNLLYLLLSVVPPHMQFSSLFPSDAIPLYYRLLSFFPRTSLSIRLSCHSAFYSPSHSSFFLSSPAGNTTTEGTLFSLVLIRNVWQPTFSAVCWLIPLSPFICALQ